MLRGGVCLPPRSPRVCPASFVTTTILILPPRGLDWGYTRSGDDELLKHWPATLSAMAYPALPVRPIGG